MYVNQFNLHCFKIIFLHIYSAAPLIEVHPPNGSVFVQKGGSIRMTCKVIDNNENRKLRVYWTREVIIVCVNQIA